MEVDLHLHLPDDIVRMLRRVSTEYGFMGMPEMALEKIIGEALLKEMTYSDFFPVLQVDVPRGQF